MDMDKIEVFILEQNRDIRDEIGSILANVEYIILGGEADTFESAMEQLDRNGVDVIIVGDLKDVDSYTVAEKLGIEFPESAIILIADQMKEDAMHKAFFAGANDVVIRPIEPAELVNSVYKANQYVKAKNTLRKENPNRARSKSGLGQVFTVIGTKGGVGKTFIAVNLAVALAKHTGKRVLLVDMDLDFGNVALALNLLPKFTVSEVVNEIKNVDQDFIENYLIHHDSGIRVLPANSQPMVSEFINEEDIDVILRTLQSVADYLVVDMPSKFDKSVTPALVVADKLLVVTTPEMAAVRNIKASLVALNELNYPRSKIKVVLNKVDPKDSISLKDVEATLNIDVFASLHVDYKNAMRSLNLGNPLVVQKPNGALSKDIFNLAKKLVEGTETAKRK